MPIIPNTFAYTSPYSGCHTEANYSKACKNLYGQKIKHYDHFCKLLKSDNFPELIIMGNFIRERYPILTLCRELGINTVHGEDGFFPHYQSCHADPLGFSWESSLCQMTFRGTNGFHKINAANSREKWILNNKVSKTEHLPATFVFMPLQLIGDKVNRYGLNLKSWLPMIEHTRKILPEDITIVVKPHPRSRDVISVDGLKNVMLVGKNESTCSLISNSRGVIGANSTVLLESRLMFKKPTWAYAKGWHTNHPCLFMPIDFNAETMPRIDWIDDNKKIDTEYLNDYTDWFLSQLLQRQFINEEARLKPSDFKSFVMSRSFDRWKLYGESIFG